MRSVVSRWCALLAVLALALLVGCGGDDENGAAQEGEGGAAASQTTTIQVGYTPSILYLPFYVAIEEGYFDERGIEIELVQTQNTNTPLLSGDVSLGLAGSDNAFVTASAGQATPILTILQQHNALSLLAQTDVEGVDPDAPYPENVQSLPDKPTVGTTQRGGGGEAFLNAVFEDAGMEYTPVILGSGANIMAALKAGRVQAGMLFPPFDSMAVSEGYAAFLVQEGLGEGPEALTARYGATVTANADWVESNPDVAQAVVDAVGQGQEFVRATEENRDRLVEIGVQYGGLDEPEAVEAALEIVAATSSGEVECERLQAQGEQLVKAGTIEELPPCEELVFEEYAPTGG